METEVNDNHEQTTQERIADRFQETDSMKLCLSNIGKWVKKQEIMTFLDQNNVKYKNVQKTKDKMFGFVIFENLEEKEAARKVIETLEYKGKKLIVGEANPLQPKTNKRKYQSVEEEKTIAKKLCSEKEVENNNNINNDEEEFIESHNVIEATAPWANKPYEEQLSFKEKDMATVLTKSCRRLRKKYDKVLGLSIPLKEEQAKLEGPKVPKVPKVHIKPKRICHEYHETGSCKYGDKCKFVHVDPSVNVEEMLKKEEEEIKKKEEEEREKEKEIKQKLEEDNNNEEEGMNVSKDGRDWGGEYLQLFPSFLRPTSSLICPLESILPSPSLQGYRNKLEFTVGMNKENKRCVGFRVGLYKEGNITVESPYEVPFISAPILSLLHYIDDFITNSKLPVYDLVSATGFWRSILIRESKYTNTLLLSIKYKSKDQDAMLIQTELDEIKNHIITESNKENHTYKVTSLYYQDFSSVSAPRPDEKPQHIYGDLYLTEQLCGKFFHISPDAFFQVNSKAAEAMYNLVGDWCIPEGKTLLLDVCCGTGTIGLCLADKVDKVIGIEICESAVLDARENARENHAEETTEWIASPAEKVLSNLLKRPDISNYDNIIAIVDPPRGGLHRDVITALRRSPLVHSIIYISCNPTGTFIDNLCDLCIPPTRTYPGTPFKPIKSKPIDLFPYTTHCELVTYFERQTEADIEGRF
ncbi:hypothetical protein WA158_008079 [Blastocystis sp. Blastoise]